VASEKLTVVCRYYLRGHIHPDRKDQVAVCVIITFITSTISVSGIEWIVTIVPRKGILEINADAGIGIRYIH